MKNLRIKSNGTENVTSMKTDNTLSTTTKIFKIDFSKVESLEQIIWILKSMNLSITWYSDNCPEQFKDLYEKDLLIQINEKQ